MFRKKIILAVTMATALFVCFTIGYVSLSNYLSYHPNTAKATTPKGATASQASSLANNVISSKTEVITTKRYVIDGTVVYTDSEEGRADSSIIGMDEKQCKDYYMKKKCSVSSFSKYKIELSEEINSWPKGCYVVKSENDFIHIYCVKDDGTLESQEETDLTIYLFSPEEQRSIKTGRVYKSLEEARRYVDEDLSS